MIRTPFLMPVSKGSGMRESTRAQNDALRISAGTIDPNLPIACCYLQILSAAGNPVEDMFTSNLLSYAISSFNLQGHFVLRYVLAGTTHF